MVFVGVFTEETRVFVAQAQVVNITALIRTGSGARVYRIIVVVARRVSTSEGETSKARRIVANGSTTNTGTGVFAQAQCIAAVFPSIRDLHIRVLVVAQVTSTYFTEAAFQTDEGVTSTEATLSTINSYFLFNLPNGIQAITQVFFTFEAQARTEVYDTVLVGAAIRITCFGRVHFVTGFDLAVQNNFSHSGNRQSSQSQSNQGFFHCCIPFLCRKNKLKNHSAIF